MISPFWTTVRSLQDAPDMRGIITALLVTGCAAQPSAPVGIDPGESGDIDNGKGDGISGIPDVHCAGTPDAGAAGKFRHFGSKVIADLGDARHRGIDTIAIASGDTQIVAGDLSYGITDKALEDEDVDVFACRAGSWQALGSARSDDEGHFEIKLGGDHRLPIGMRDMYLSVRGDRSGVAFLAYVADDGAPLAVSDVDGTLTSSENAFGETIILGISVDIQPNAPAAFQTLADRGYQPVYLTARSRAWTEVTRQWLADNGMPRGPLRLAPHTLLPGSGTADYKAQTLASFTGFELALGNGNRATDIDAYTQAGVAPDRITIKLPEFADEVQAHLDAGDAIGIDDYSQLQALAERFPAR
jgi:hypothetical protein